MPDQSSVPEVQDDADYEHDLFGTLTAGGERNFLDTLRAENIGALLLLVASIIALVWASSPWESVYRTVSETTVGPGSIGLDLTIATWATDGLLAFFFFVVGLELKREFVEGELSSPRRAALPILAAVGGMAAPALIYTLVNVVGSGEPRGWAIPTATDIAFAVAVISAFGRRLPTALRAFLLTLAVADDFGGIIIIATVFAHGLQFGWLLAAAGCIALFRWLVRRRTHPAVLFVVGALAWWAVHTSGVHATITGAALAFTVPAATGLQGARSVAERLEHVWRPFTAAVAVPLFAFFAVGLHVDVGLLREALGSPVGLGVVLGLVVGKPIGIMVATFLSARLMGLHGDRKGTWLDLLAVSFTAGIGFTVALLVNSLTFGAAETGEVATAGILIASIVSAIIGAVLLSWRSRVAEARKDPVPTA